MNIKKELQNKLPEVNIPSHQHALKEALLQTYSSSNKRTNPVLQNLPMKGGEYFMHHKFLTFGMTSIAVIALVVTIFVVGGSPLSPVKPTQAEAQELLDKSIDRIIRLSPAEQKELEKRLQADLQNSLKEARNAKDLEIVPESEIERVEAPVPDAEKPNGGIMFEKQIAISGEPSLDQKSETGNHVVIKDTKDEQGETDEMGKPHAPFMIKDGKIPAPTGVTVLRYTNSDGGKVLLGIDKDDKPVFKLIKMEKNDINGKKGSNVMFFQKHIN